MHREPRSTGRSCRWITRLKNGDIVEIITAKADNPSIDWLNFARTSAAKTKIKAFFKKQKTEENVGEGQRAALRRSQEAVA